MMVPAIWAPVMLTKPELQSFVIGEKVSEGFTPFHELITSTPILTQWMYGITDILMGRSLTGRHVLAFVILFIQACYLGIVFINKKAFAENTYVPSALFIILCAFSFDVITITGTLLASGFLLLAINSLFNEIEFREPKDETLLKLGFYLSLASLSDFSFVVFFVAANVVLILYTRTSLRRNLLYFTGFLLPHALLISWFYFTDSLGSLWQFFYKPSFTWESERLISFKTLLVLGSVPLFYFVVSFFLLNRAVRLTNYQSQLLQAMFIWLLAGVAHLFFTPLLRPQSLLPLLPPLAFLLAHSLLAIRRRRIADFHLWILLAGTLATATAVRFQWIQPGGYDSLVVSSTPGNGQQKVLVLANDLQPYVYNELATGFQEWVLIESVWQHPEYYENVVLVGTQLTRDWPERIIDPDNRLESFLPFLPHVQARYEKKGINYVMR